MQVVERQQTSIVQSLSELRDIERQRIADEVAAVQRTEAARIAAREAAEGREREEEAARARAEREAQLAAEQARLEAERAERRRIDAAAAAELARQQVALEHTRLEREVELRRAEVARTRPTWMVAVTGLALAAAGAMLWLALSSRALAEEASAGARVAWVDRDRAREDARQARDELGRLEREVAGHTASLRSLLEQIRRAKDDMKIVELEDRANRERQRQRAIEEALRKAREKKAREDRVREIGIPEECKRNPFAPGCDGK